VNNEKLPPHDLDAEEAIIGSLLIDGTAIYKIAMALSRGDFYHERNQWLYEACLALYERNEAINQITMAQELARRDKLEAIGGAAFLSHLISVCPTPLDIEHYAQIVYRLSVMRGLIGAADQIARVGYDAGPDVDTSLSRAEDILFRLRHGHGERDFVHIRQVLDKYFEAAPPSEEEGGAREQMPYVLSNFVGLDEFLGGFQRSDLVIVAGRPSMGKSSLGLSIARNVAVEQKACVAFFSLEMSRESIVMRFLASESGVNSRRVRFGLHTEDEERHIMDATGVLSEAAIFLDDSPQLRVVEMRSKARRLHFERGLDLIVVDYLQLMQGEGRGENRVQEISYISRSLKALSRELNVPVIAISQLSRQVEWRASHIPQLADLRESGSIEQDADVVIFIYRDEYYHTEEEWQLQHPDREYPREEADIIVAKNRNGPTGQIKLRFRHNLATFYNYEYPVSSEEPKLL
jgi:replicative DNA helicase